jgi:hypothetical protein
LHVLFYTTIKRAGISASAFPKLTAYLATVTKALEDKAKQFVSPTTSNNKAAEASIPAQQLPPIPAVTPSYLDTNSIDWSATGLVSSLKIIFDAAIIAAFPELATHPELNLHKPISLDALSPRTVIFNASMRWLWPKRLRQKRMSLLSMQLL